MLASKNTRLGKQWLGASAVAGVAWIVACGGTPATTTAPTGGTSVAVAPPPPVSRPIPDRIDDLSVFATRSAALVVSLPNLDGLRAALDPTLVATLENAAADGLSSRSGLPRELTARFIASYDGALGFGTWSDGDPRITVAIRMKDPTVVPELAAATKLEPVGPDRWRGGRFQVAWLDKARVLVAASDAATLEGALQRATGIGGDFEGSPLAQKRPAGEPWASVDLAAMGVRSSGLFDPGSRALAWYEPKTGLHVDYAQLGNKVPSLGKVLAPSTLASVDALPDGAMSVSAVSLARAKGATFQTLFDEVDRISGQGSIGTLLSSFLGVDAPGLDGLIGDELALAIYPLPKRPTKRAEPEESGVLVARLATPNADAAKFLVNGMGKLLSSRTGFKASPGKVLLTRDKIAVDIEAQPNGVLVVAGQKALVTTTKANVLKPKKRMGDDPRFAGARKNVPAKLSALTYTDLGLVTKSLPDPDGELAKTPQAEIMMSLVLAPNAKGIEASFIATSASPQAGVAAGVGVLAAVAISGVRTYLLQSKAVEARSTLAAIARGAAASYEREGTNGKHALCATATAVPADVPKGKKYAASPDPGKDYETGTDAAGWKCLRFSMGMPQYYRYEYRAGSGYKGPARGGPNPGPNGFEASAEGDLDGDGKSSLFTLTGKIDPKTKSVVIGELFAVDETE